MSQNFNDFLNNKGKKENPVTKKDQKQQYKSVRIYPEDYEDFREIAFKERKAVVEVISEALELLKEKNN